MSAEPLQLVDQILWGTCAHLVLNSAQNVVIHGPFFVEDPLKKSENTLLMFAELEFD